ncbi:MAG: putative zinc-binding metallopeptidase [Flavihumibacter sp.]
MQLFTCTSCGNPVYFENIFCGNCGSSLGFDARQMKTVAFAPGNGFRYCNNYSNGVCNWVLPAGSMDAFCIACSLNRTIPPIHDPAVTERWKKVEVAKHRLVYGLLRLGLPVMNKTQDPGRGLAFDLLSEKYISPNEKLVTGHLNGLITLNIKEADDIEREMAKRNLQEQYRTLLGHFRHEIAHYYWDLLVAGSDNLPGFRDLFGDENLDYQQAMNRHYSQGAPANSADAHISAYATMHPWEDWAETWAHYMHITDTLETAYSFGLSVDPLVARGKRPERRYQQRPLSHQRFCRDI